MPKHALTDARIEALRPRNTAYDMRDARLKGFGVRVRKRYADPIPESGLTMTGTF